MERKSSKEYSFVFLGEGKKFKLLKLSLLSVLLRNQSAQSLSSQYFAAVPTPNIAELVPSGFFLSTIMVIAAARTHFPRKTPTCLVDRTAINKQLFKYNNEHNFIRSGRFVEWLERSPSIRVSGVPIHKGRFLFSFFFVSFLSFFWGVIALKNK